MIARKTLVAAAAALALIPAVSLPAAASTRAGYRDPGRLRLYISAPYQDNGVTVINLWWTAPKGATSYSLTANEITGLGPDSYIATGLPHFGASMPFVVQVEGDTPLLSATFQVADNEGDISNTVTYS